MRQTRPLKSSTFRLTLAYLGLFGISSGILLATINLMTTRFNDQQVRSVLEEEIAWLSTQSGGQIPVLQRRAGGDDYLVKPFAFSELVARLEALARRANSASSDVPETVLRYDDLTMDLLSRRVERAARPIDLQPREFRLLEVLLRHAGQVMTRTMLLEKVWDYRFDPQTNVIDVHISRLRQKVDRGYEHPLIHTVRGAGYSLRAPDKAA